MGRGTATLVVASVGLLSFGMGGRRPLAGGGPPRFALLRDRGLWVVVGTGFAFLNAGVTDEYLRKHLGSEENAKRLRQSWRGGWVGVLIGAVMIAAEYFLGLG